ncbi:MAG: epimerase [Pseudomonas sp.]|nr:epimerase [Pseudomonas sp.]
MNVLLFGATGMVGMGVLQECLAAPDVQRVVTVGRTTMGQEHPKLTEIVRLDLLDYWGLDAELQGFDACFFCLGVSSAGLSEVEYSRVTYDVTLAAATELARLNPQMAFVYVSGAGTDSSEKGRSMWARVKGKTENALLRLPFRGVYLFRPGVIQPLNRLKSKTTSYRVFYSLARPLLPVLRWLMPNVVLTTTVMGQAMLNAARRGANSAVLEAKDINVLANQRGLF